MIKIIFSIIISLISFNVYSNNIEIKNDKKGDGIEIINHSKVKVHYIGKLETGIEFDNSFKRKKPFTFQIGTRQVIEGWDIGLIGMQVGGKRTLIIPPELAYGKKGVGDLIPPNAILIFDIDIITLNSSNVNPPLKSTVSNIFMFVEEVILAREIFFKIRFFDL